MRCHGVRADPGRRHQLVAFLSPHLVLHVAPFIADWPTRRPDVTTGTPYHAYGGLVALALIDLHHHVVPPVYREALAAVGETEVGHIPLPPWSADRCLTR